MGKPQRACLYRSGGETRRCTHYRHCKRIEATGVTLPCERLLDWEVNDQPGPSRLRVTKPRNRRTEKLVATNWPDGEETITIAEFAAALDADGSTARRHLERAVELGLVCHAGRRGKATLYARNGDLAEPSRESTKKMRGKKG